jgi:hypothetical protein
VVNQFIDADIDAIHELPPNGRFSLNPGHLTLAVKLMPQPPQTLVFQLRIKYVYKSQDQSASFRFTAERKTDGDYVWLPMDPARDIDQVLREMSG